MPEIAEITVNGQPKKVNFEINGEIYTLGGGREPVIEPLTVTRNGDYRPPTGTDGYAPVTVDIPSDRKPEQEKSLRATDNGTFSIKPDGGKVLSGVTVNVDVPKKKPEQTKTVTITQNGDVTITPDVGRVLTSVLAKVDVPQAGIPGYKTLMGSFTMNQTHSGAYAIQGAGGFNTSLKAFFLWNPSATVSESDPYGIIALAVTSTVRWSTTQYYMKDGSIAFNGVNEFKFPDKQTEFVTILPDDTLGASLNRGRTYNWIYVYTEV